MDWIEGLDLNCRLWQTALAGKRRMAAAAATAAGAEALDKNSSDTGARIDHDSGREQIFPAKKSEDREKVRLLSVDKITLEKIVLERTGGSREILLTKNESSRKLSINKSVSERANSGKFRASVPKEEEKRVGDAPSKQTAESWTIEKRANPVKLIKSSSSRPPIDGGPKKNLGQILEKVCPSKFSVKVDCEDEANAKDRLEKSRTKIEVLQQNLSARIDASTARRYKEELLGNREGNGAARRKLDSNVERLASGGGSKLTFDEEFLQKHNLDKRLKIEEYGRDSASTELLAEGGEEERRRRKLGYSEKVLEVEKRWSGEFLKDQLDRRSSGSSSKSSYVEELGSVSSSSGGESEDYERGGGPGSTRRALPFEPGCQGKRDAGDSTLSIVDSDSCLEERIKSLEQDIGEKETKGRFRDENDTDDDCDDCNDDGVELDGQREITERRQRSRIGSNRDDISSATSTDSVDFAAIGGDRFGADGYANLIREFAMEAGGSSSSRPAKREEKQKRKLGLRRLLPGFFSPKDSRKEYGGKKKESSKERKKPDDKHFARYQQNGNYTRSPDTMNLNEDIKRNVKLDNSLNGSIIEERLDEIKRELFPDHQSRHHSSHHPNRPNHPDQGPITSTPDHLARDDEDREGLLLRDRSGAPRCYATDSSLSSIAPDERWNERNAQLGISPDIRKFEERQKREELGQRYNNGQRYGQLERKHSLQEPPSHAAVRPSCFFQRNHGPSGRISAPPSERYLVRPRAVHPMDRPLPAIPRFGAEPEPAADYENYLAEQEEEEEEEEGDKRRKAARYGRNAAEYLDEVVLPPARAYENEEEEEDPSGLILKSVSAQVKITRQPIVNQNHRAPLVGRSPRYLSSGSSQKSGDYGDSSCTPNSSQKSEFSPSSSKSGEYYLHSPRNSGSPPNAAGEFDDCDDSPRRDQIAIYENSEKISRSPPAGCANERIYDQTPGGDHASSPCEENSANERRRSIEDSLDNGRELSSPPTATTAARCRGERCSVSPGENLANEKREHEANEDRGELRIEKNRSPASPTESLGKSISSFGSRQRLSAASRRTAQPNEQILIASPKRETAPSETRIPRRPSNESRRCAMESPIRMSNAPRGSLDRRSQDSGSSKAAASREARDNNTDAEISRPEPVYAQKGQKNPATKIGSSSPPTTRILQSPDGEDRVAWVQAHASSPRASPQKPNATPLARSREKVQSQTQRSPRTVAPSPQRRNEQGYSNVPPSRRAEERSVPRPEAALYVQRICEPSATYGGHVQRGTHNAAVAGPLSPSKQQTRQHLEAFYWQQKALEARRKSLAHPTNAGSRQVARKIDLPEVREAMYWQQLKKLDEEQQRRIYEQNATEEPVFSCCRKNANLGQTLSPQSPPSVGVPSIAHGDHPASWIGGGNVGCQQQQPRGCPTKTTNLNPAGKPPLMQSQKGQNQPVLIVRPQQQAIRERRDLVATSSKPPLLESVVRQEAQRSKSASPHFHRVELPPQTANRQAKLDVSSSVYEEETNNDVDGKTSTLVAPPPPPIFKRGSLIGGEQPHAVQQEYASVGGAKRVSFSNQSAVVGQDLASVGNWPTKHGTAPEPPTRRHRSEDSVSDTDSSVFSHQERRDALYATVHADGTEYDADRPLPPLPKDIGPVNGPSRLATSLAHGEVRWNDPGRAVSPQRMPRRNGECLFFFFSFSFSFAMANFTSRCIQRSSKVCYDRISCIRKCIE
ncbi:hypothetical protein K0M31_008555 [Melipona bicolor]|uniref:Uncharacterized protein n=1 Tax=Melipona bicolor TaxID=60889 RepID=A0AA40FS35_9HYME|nr:hypothetical protein K0M31_008555 [Melipona bicolor]